MPIVFPLSSSDRIRNNLLNYKKAKGASSLATNATNSRITPTKLKRITNKKYLATALDVQKALKQLKTLELVNAALNSTNNSATSVDEVESSSIEISIQSEKIESFLDKMMAVRDLPISKYALPSMTELPVMSTAIAQRSALGCSLRL